MLETFKLAGAIMLLALISGCAEMKIKKSCCAGTWYNADKEELSEEINGYLKNTVDKKITGIKAIIVPHAGIAYSGSVAAKSFKQLENEDFNKVIILGTAHTYPLEGASMLDVDYYETPLGNVQVCGDVKDKKILKNVDEAHVKEHSIEIELPFLQKILKDFCIVPIIVGRTNTTEFSNFLSKNIDNKTLIVVSVDLSHFHDYDAAKKLDTYSINSILNLEEGNIEDSEIDSPYAVMSVIELAKKFGWKTELLEYKNSGDITGDKTSVVGYSAIVFYEGEKNILEKNYTEEEKRYILNLAKHSVEKFVKTGKKNKAKNIPDKLKEERACFVTLTEKDELRGCIGNLEPAGPLYQSIVDNAISACSEDPRFSPVEEKELDRLHYEVSVLTEPKKIDYTDEPDLFKKIKGKGIILKKGFYQATYLPQVWAQFDNEKDFLSSLCQKAGLSKNSWKENIEVYAYDAVVVE
jgi:AmmeMemoRadiSam system protein B/AmmeMemoRadiSam system protein A